MATFGYAEMRDWAEQSDDPRVKAMWQRLSNCRSKIAKWCQAAEYAELRTKNLAAENTALRAEVERLRADYAKLHRAFWLLQRVTLPPHDISGTSMWGEALSIVNALPTPPEEE